MSTLQLRKENWRRKFHLSDTLNKPYSYSTICRSLTLPQVLKLKFNSNWISIILEYIANPNTQPFKCTSPNNHSTDTLVALIRLLNSFILVIWPLRDIA